jgi:8-oxo-dGTP pyrophosphatase MutT (NUDIX family)
MVHATDLASALRGALGPDPQLRSSPGDRLAAVLALLVMAGEPSLVFTVRAAALSRHAGEISFPGGMQDPGETLEQTALRETHEEIGLEPSLPDVLGTLAPMHTFVSGILVAPFVGMVDALPPLTVSDAEIDEVLVIPVVRLATVERTVEYDRPDARVWRGFAYDVDGHTVWGVTGWIVHMLLQTIRQETTWTIP